MVVSAQPGSLNAAIAGSYFDSTWDVKHAHVMGGGEAAAREGAFLPKSVGA